MKYIRLFENYNSNDEDVEYILSDYVHDGKVEVTKNNYYKIYKFIKNNTTDYNSVIKELDSHNLKYIKAINYNNQYIITRLSEKIINFLDSNILSLASKKRNNNFSYLDSKNNIKGYYNNDILYFWIDVAIWESFKLKFNSYDIDIVIILTWYIKSNLHNQCNACLPLPGENLRNEAFLDD